VLEEEEEEDKVDDKDNDNETGGLGRIGGNCFGSPTAKIRLDPKSVVGKKDVLSNICDDSSKITIGKRRDDSTGKLVAAHVTPIIRAFKSR